MTSPDLLPRRPEARTDKVEDLVHRVLRGQVRIPSFQRGLNWESKDVARLFDSIYRGYPIGSLLFFKRAAKAEKILVGPLPVEAEETTEAWWVVDGQQRLTSLTACLARDVPLPERRRSADPYVLYFDPSDQTFEPPPTSGAIPTRWVPLPWVLDASKLTEWVFTWKHGNEEVFRRRVFEAGARIREYSIPLYLIDTDEPGVPEEIFYRTNDAGVPLRWDEVHKALFGGSEDHPSTLAELAVELAQVGMGRLDENRMLTCLLAMRGEDPTRSLGDHYQRDPRVLRDAVQESVPVLRRVFSFLRSDASIPHLRLLPKSILLDVLTRFFAIHEAPSSRTRALLIRWFWRAVVGVGKYNDRTMRRRGIKAVVENEEESAQRLLGLLHRDSFRPFELPHAFDARADESRIALLTLADLKPKMLDTEARIDIAGLIENDDLNAFGKILKLHRLNRSRSPANRLIQPAGVDIKRLIGERVTGSPASDVVLRSHGIDEEAARRFKAEDWDGFLERRAEILTKEARRFIDGRAAWGHNDRPSIDHLLEPVADSS